MEPILADGGTTLMTYIAMDAAGQSPYNILYKNLVVTIIMTKNCGYDSLRKRLAQHHMSPHSQACPTSSNDLAEMMNSENFEPDPFKPKLKRSNRVKNKKKEDKDEKQ